MSACGCARALTLAGAHPYRVIGVNWLATIKLGLVRSTVQEFFIDPSEELINDRRKVRSFCLNRFVSSCLNRFVLPLRNLVNESMARKVDLTDGVGDASDRGRSMISIFNTHELPPVSYLLQRH